MIRQWLFPLHIDEMLACLERTFSSKARSTNLTGRELENLVAVQRCTATSIATINSNQKWEAELVL
jgi:hypothetical protein